MTNPLNTFIQQEQERWKESDAAKRVGALESFCHVHGWPEFEGQNIPDFLKESHSRLLEKVREILEDAWLPDVDAEHKCKNMGCYDHDKLSALLTPPDTK